MLNMTFYDGHPPPTPRAQGGGINGVQASIDYNGRLHLTALDGRGIFVEGAFANANGTEMTGVFSGVFGFGSGEFFGGRLTLTKLDASDIRITGTSISFSLSL